MIDVVGAVIRDDDRYLACRRLPSRGGKWEFPGGKVEPGETLKHALQREIAEELGISIRVGAQIIAVELVQAGLRLATFSATLQSVRPVTSTDHDRLEWLALAELLDRDWAEADLPTVRLLTRTSA